MHYLTGTCRRAVARLSAVAIITTVFFTANTSASEASLSLAEASRLTIGQHPRLAIFDWRFAALEGERQNAALQPATTLSFDAENILGGGDLSGVESAELTLSLSSVIELGGKAEARLAVIDARMAHAEAARQAEALDLLAEVTRRYLNAQVLQEKVDLSEKAQSLAETAFALTSRRVESGATPQAERLRAQADLAKAALQHRALQSELQSSRMALASLWGAERVEFGRLEGELLAFADPGNFEDLFRRVTDSPAIRMFTAEQRVRQAAVDMQLARSRLDIGWSLGVRQFVETDQAAMVAGISVPLFTASRQEGNIKAAMAQRSQVDYQKRASMLDLRATLYSAWQSYRQNSATALELQGEVLPLLEQALTATRQAYERGAYEYLVWADAQQQLIDTQLAIIDKAGEALLNLALIEQLTGVPITTLTSDTGTAQSRKQP